MITGCESVEGRERISPFKLTERLKQKHDRDVRIGQYCFERVHENAERKGIKTTELIVREHFYSDWGINATIEAHLRKKIIRLS